METDDMLKQYLLVQSDKITEKWLSIRRGENHSSIYSKL